MASRSLFALSTCRGQGAGQLSRMNAGSPVLLGLSLYRMDLDRGVHKGTPALWRLPMRTPVIVGYTSLNPVCYQGLLRPGLTQTPQNPDLKSNLHSTPVTMTAFSRAIAVA